jgi:hypothetical protein
VEKAIIKLLNEKGGNDVEMEVHFNPSDFSTSHSARYIDPTGISPAKKPQNEFVTEENTVLKLRLTFDGFTKANTLDPEKAGDISGELETLRSSTYINAELHRPPVFVFDWGSFKFCGHTQSLNINYTMFSSKGKPIRATVDLTVKSNADYRQAVALKSPDRTKRRVLIQDTPLCYVAFDAYNDPAEWRRIAVANGIKNPRRLRAGAALRIPPIECAT